MKRINFTPVGKNSHFSALKKHLPCRFMKNSLQNRLSFKHRMFHSPNCTVQQQHNNHKILAIKLQNEPKL